MSEALEYLAWGVLALEATLVILAIGFYIGWSHRDNQSKERRRLAKSQARPQLRIVNS